MSKFQELKGWWGRDGGRAEAPGKEEPFTQFCARTSALPNANMKPSLLYETNQGFEGLRESKRGEKPQRQQTEDEEGKEKVTLQAG